MDMAGKDNLGAEKGNDDPLNFHSPNMSSDWQFIGANLANSSMGSIPTGNPMAASKGDLLESSSCSSASMVDSFCPANWEQTTHSQNLGFCEINVQHGPSTSNMLGIRTSGLGPIRTGAERTVGIGWTPPNAMLKGGLFLPTASGMLPQSLSQFPADSGFIERAARFSCFSAGNFGDMMNPFSIPESMSPYSRSMASMQGPHRVFSGEGSKTVSGEQYQKIEINVTENPKDVEHGAIEGSPLKNERKTESSMGPHDEPKRCSAVSGNESDEAEFSGGGQEEQSMLEGRGGEPSTKRLGSKKRKRSGQDNEIDQVKGATQQPSEIPKDNAKIQQQGNQNLVSASNRPGGKQGKQGIEASDSPKDEYIHVRARRGQATNSHSLAERVRREKISERMKFLQDLVPGCSKVTGKAVMLDEIINYVQSLQRQVEFLSMKLATVHPRLDFNIEGLLTKDVLQSRAGPSSLGFPPDMTMPYSLLHSSHPGVIHTVLPGVGNSSDALRRTINSHVTAMSGEYKESTSHVPNVWEDELHNVIHMDFNSGATSALLNGQDIRGIVSFPT
ncbi:unnamed protein product [Ilex paraguariensis]|uniref:BHLH domain-containing protein n=1 Tax=Ilex paraguariensis TaxID=185542 RepID=A0ABC8SSE2_9AQUA